MATSSGIRVRGSGDYMKIIALKDEASYGPWRAKLTSILDAKDCLEIVSGTKTESVRIAIGNDAIRRYTIVCLYGDLGAGTSECAIMVIWRGHE